MQNCSKLKKKNNKNKTKAILITISISLKKVILTWVITGPPCWTIIDIISWHEPFQNINPLPYYMETNHGSSEYSSSTKSRPKSSLTSMFWFLLETQLFGFKRDMACKIIIVNNYTYSFQKSQIHRCPTDPWVFSSHGSPTTKECSSICYSKGQRQRNLQ